ncbi:NADH-quinone oxidoreductase subunit NuoF family protein [Actinacidiphila glaucinigra]|uniref:NADH:ubiquinone oxidoreductase, NADH-binding subunit (Chain F) n=1 Tax=Actinacidiphila glaucinigra TaxID=235986 RepID=A0A239LAS4_9ACTN|nr:NADH-quinone oxidoreductase subunit NuoF family protein [Actinacidiphila glaucinigra]SNT27726.1 NADH:ubiquinone oxidoreductase, NADH-binding subunit (chain F) [Actinacidiphila glaucinigra]
MSVPAIPDRSPAPRSGAGDVLPDVRTVGLPRITAGFDEVERLDRVTHLNVHGSMPSLTEGELLDLAELMGLRGRGGAGFPFYKKLKAVGEAARRRGTPTAVMVNGCEGEPACRKDAVILRRAPHLMLDGALLCAEILGARELVISVTRDTNEQSVRDALAERGLGTKRGRQLRARIVRMPERFVSGESSGIISAANGGLPLPPGKKVSASESGLGGMPTLFSNTETFTQLAIGARMGAIRFGSAGAPGEPGTAMLTVSGSVPRQTVVETPTGVPMSYILQMCGGNPGQGVLVGGYHGAWIDPSVASMVTISRESLEAHKATLGAGALLPLDPGLCPLGESLLVAQWLAAETAGQCGPCRLGLPRMAGLLQDVLNGGGQAALEQLRQTAVAVKGRGVCKHPDGSMRFVMSSINAFTDDLAAHVLGGGCGRPTVGVLPLLKSDPPMPRGGGSAGAAAAAPSNKRLNVDWTLCKGHGLCAGVLPEIVRLDRDGYPDIAGTPVPPHLDAAAQRAVARCPALALRMEEGGRR